MKSYTDFPGLEEVVLEESYVLDIAARPGLLELTGDFVLVQSHPRYHTPPADESDCFVRGGLRFTGVRSLAWERQGGPPATDAAGEVDYGHIDDMRWEGDAFELEGDWGQIRVTASRVSVVLAD